MSCEKAEKRAKDLSLGEKCFLTPCGREWVVIRIEVYQIYLKDDKERTCGLAPDEFVYINA